jgi:DegV family protein with EDD domain
MSPALKAACIAGYERMSAWSDLLDEINVFPVADADTGRNLRISLAPVMATCRSSEELARRLLRAATGNSGNIAAAFFSVFLAAASGEDLVEAARSGARSAWQAVSAPKPGTMLTVFDAFADALDDRADQPLAVALPRMVADLVRAVDTTAETLPEMRLAGVVDAGALGMFIFFEALLAALAGVDAALKSPPALFGKRVIGPAALPGATGRGTCINAWICGAQDPEELVRQAAGLGDSLVTTAMGRDVKLHLHARHPDLVAQHLGKLGELADWEAQPLEDAGVLSKAPSDRVHVMTDAAGSLPADAARALGVTLLDSYIVTSDASRPETLTAPASIYAALSRGERVSTAQASRFERHERYGSVLSRFDQALYLCVGSVYTGNHAAALDWCRQHDPEGRMAVIDSGAASGRLGLMALALARHAAKGRGLADLRHYAQALIERCDELVFLDRLKFLAAGGRVSKTGGFFGDLLHVRPIITPTAGGVRKVGVVRRRRDQLPLALSRLASVLGDGDNAIILLQYTDNRKRVEEEIRPAMAARFAAAEILVHPLSLTSGVHMGPGTWAVAFVRLPEAEDGF